MRKGTGILLLLFVYWLPAQECKLSLTGHYSGKDIFLQNPFVSRMKGHCIQKVFVNDSLWNVPNASVIQLNLRELQISDGDTLSISIIHGCGCLPKVLNPQSHFPNTLKKARLTLFQDSFIVLRLSETKKEQKYYFQQYRWNRWNTIDSSVSCNKKDTLAMFNIKPVLHSGENRFRVLASGGFVSHTLKINGPAPLEFDLEKSYSGDKIELPFSTCYEIWSDVGKKIRSGCGKEIDISNLYKGLFYLNYDNKTGKFLRK
jgi:hypothetical protein